MNDPSLVDSAVLARILLLQTALQAAPDEQCLIEMVAHEVTSLPGIIDCMLCVEGKTVRMGSPLQSPIHTACSTTSANTETPFVGCGDECPAGYTSWKRIALVTSRRDYGAIFLHVEDAKAYATYSAFINNTVNLVALRIENNRHAAELNALNRGLDEQIRERTAQLRESENRFRSYVESAPHGIFVVDEKGNFIDVNEAAAVITGYSCRELLGMHFLDITPVEQHPEGKEYFKQLTTTGNVVYDVPLVKKNGDRGFGTVSATRLSENRYIGFVIDITDRKQAEDALRMNKERLDLTLSVINDGMFDWDLTTGKIYLDARYYEMAGYEPNEFPGTIDNWTNRVYPEDWVKVEVAVKELMKIESTKYDQEFRYKRKDGTWMWIRARIKIVERDDQGVPLRMVGTHTDITGRKQAEEEVRNHQEKLAHVGRLSMMGEMTTGLAHELNQPLTAISSYCFAGSQYLTDNLTDNTPVETQVLRELFEKSSEQALRAGEIIRRLRALVSKRTAVRALVDISEPIQEVLDVLDANLRERNVCVELQIDQAQTVVSIDAIQIQQVLVNLICNAIDAMSGMKKEQKTITIAAAQTADNMVETTVCDTGEGFSFEENNQVFDAFFSTKAEGMGMGLAISRTIIELHGGRLWVTPNPERGVTFHFTLPVEWEDNEESRVVDPDDGSLLIEPETRT